MTICTICTIYYGDGGGLGGEDGLRLFGDLAHEALAGGGRGRDYVGGHGVGDEVALQLGDLAAAEVAGLCVHLGLTHAVLGQKLEREEDEVVFRDVIADGHASSSFLRLNSALRIRVFTVPSGSPVISAISEWVSPSKYAISSVFLCSNGRCRDDGPYPLHHGVSLGLVGQIEGRGEINLLDLLAGALAAQGVDGAIASDDGEPAAEAAAGGDEGVRAAPEAEKDILKNVLGGGGVAEDAERDRVHDPGVPVVERGHSLLVATPHPVQQLTILLLCLR